VGGIRDVNAFDAVLVGEYEGERLVYRGVVEWGFKAADVVALLRCAKNHPMRTSPFADLRRTKHEGVRDSRSLTPCFLVAGARKHLPANRPLESLFEIRA
jgi:hypothetical protein